MPATSDDPDLAHLFELLRMLPGPRENPKFWAAVADHTGDGGTSVGYVFEKLSLIWRAVRDPTPAHIRDLARYLLYFFAGDNPELWKILNTVTRNQLTMPRDETGRWWAEDVSRTAWTLYVRYNQAAGDQWTRKWEYRESWEEWRQAGNPG